MISTLSQHAQPGETEYNLICARIERMEKTDQGVGAHHEATPRKYTARFHDAEGETNANI